MNFNQLIEHCTIDTVAMEEEGYDSWVPKDDTVILTISDRDGTWQRVNYLQLIDKKKMYNDDDEDNFVLVMQLDGQPEDPNNTCVLDSITIRIFKEDR